MSGFYNNWVKVNNSDLPNNIVQMQSGGSQTPFYFGGSNVPNALHIHSDISGGGFFDKVHTLPYVEGKGTQYTARSGGKIHMPRQMGSLSRSL